MKTPVQALLWEQWRQTWKVIPFMIAIGITFLWFIPQFFESPQDSSYVAHYLGVIGSFILCGIMCMALQTEGGQRGGTLANRHFVLPVSSFTIAAIPVLVFGSFLILNLWASRFVLSYDSKTDRVGLRNHMLTDQIRILICGVLAYSLTIRVRDIPMLRINLMLFVWFILAYSMYMAKVQFSAWVPMLATLLFSVPIAAVLINYERHNRASKVWIPRFTTSIFRTLSNLFFNMALNVPRGFEGALLWSELRGGKKLQLPVFISLTGMLILIGISYTGRLVGETMQRLNAPDGLQAAWGPFISVSGAGIFIYLVTRLSSRMTGSSRMFAPWSPEMGFWKRQPVKDRVLSTVKLQSTALQVSCWILSLSFMVAFVPLFLEGFKHGFDKVLRDATSLRNGTNALWVLFHDIARVSIYGALLIWSIAGLLVAISLTGRKWFYNLAYPLAGFSAMAVFRLATIYNSSDYYEMVQPIKWIAGAVLILFAIVPLIICYINLYAHRSTLIILTAILLIAEALLLAVRSDNQAIPSLFTIGIYAIPFAPLGLLPMAMVWGRRL